MFAKLKSSRGFTLIEVLLVVAIVAILAGIVILAINPAKQLGDSRNATRQADVQTILNAIYQYGIDLHGVPGTLPSSPTDICSTGFMSCPYVNLSVLTDNGKYLVAMPKDPQLGDNNNTHYRVSQDANGRITVSAPGAEQGATISVTR
ncbi:MAG TPA: type II secretion system protein [Candidatus Saccharimonadales bacterium]|nr:type II secretion system protein [Candidatus Saccharimonadales bacterium]